MSDLETRKRRYVELIVNLGANVQRDQQVLIMVEPSSVELAEMAAEFCYRRGARYVDVQLTIPTTARNHLLWAPGERLGYVPVHHTVQMDQLVDSGGALIAFRSQDEPDLFEDLDAEMQGKLNHMLVARREASKRYREEGVLKRKVGWCLAGPPSPKWAHKIFPNLDPDKAQEALWEDILGMTFAGHKDCLELWSRHLDSLGLREAKLNSLGIRKLRFVNEANQTDLTVTLSPESRWVSGRKKTAAGVEVCLNIPTFEVFTTPDWRGTQGEVTLTRPVMINGSLVEGLRLKFVDGEIVEVEAAKNQAVYEALINTPGDPTARRLGEVALVGVDSPIFTSGRIYQHTLYDENAACHIATGMAYTVGVHDGDRLSPEELDRIGFNRNAKTHQDVMISDHQTTVIADGKELIVNGAWVDGLL